MIQKLNKNWKNVVVIKDGQPDREATIQSLDAYLNLLESGTDLMASAIDMVFKENKDTKAIRKETLIGLAAVKTGRPLSEYSILEELAAIYLKDYEILRLGSEGGGVKNPFYVESK